MLKHPSTHPQLHFKHSGKINYLAVVNFILRKWYWILTALILGAILGYLYLAYTPQLYETSALLKFDEKKSEISELINVRNMYDRTNKIESEKSVIRSRNVLQRAIKSLNYEVSFYSTKLGEAELYPYQPLKIETLKNRKFYSYKNFGFKAIDNFTFELCYNNQNRKGCGIYEYGQIISLHGLKLKILTADKNLGKGNTFYFRLNDKEATIDRINRSLKLDETPNISLLNLKYTDNNPILATDMLNAILKEYIAYDKLQRSVVASQTASFISSLLQTMADTVKKSGLAIQEFKQDNESLAITDNLDIITNRLANLHIEKHTLDINLILIASIENSLKEVANNQLTYNLQGATDILLNQALSKYNDLVSKRKQLLNTYTENSPSIIQLDEQIADSKIAITKNISYQRESNRKKAGYLLDQIDSINIQLADLPRTERNFVTLQARFDIHQKVYNYLAEKKLEAEISKAAVTPGAVIIDSAIYPDKAISPVPKSVFLFSTALCTLLSIIIIYLTYILNPHIYNKDVIEEYSQIPTIGVIRKYRGNVLDKHSAITLDPRSIFSESVRSVRSNLSFFASERNSKVICITSEISGEGKSFVSANLAISLTLTQNKVLLVAADLRKSKLHDNFNISNLNGLSIFLSGQASLNELATPTEIENLYLIPSGPVPPNPSELLLNKRMQDLINYSKKHYDYIIIDTAPIGLVTDGKPLLKMADISLFILRSGVSKRYYASSPDQLKMELGLENISIVLNDYDDRNLHSHYYTNKHTVAQGTYYHPLERKYKYEDYLEL